MWHFLVLIACIANSDPPAVREDVFIPNLYLVRAHAIRVAKKAGKAVGATFEIEHVYLGPTSLKGETFEVSEMAPFQNTVPFQNSTHSNIVEATVGEIGIWWIVRCDDEEKPHSDGKKKTKKSRFVAESSHPLAYSELGGRWGTTFGQSRKIDYNYESCKKIAQEIERVYRSDGSQRIELLKQRCRSEDDFMVEWSIQRLERLLSKKDLTALYKEMFSSRYPISSEQALDWSLSNLSPEWRGCDDRIKLIRHWMTDKLLNQEDDELRITNYFSAGNDALPPFTRFLDLILDGLLAKHRTDGFKIDLLGSVSSLELSDKIVIDKAVIDDGFEHLLSQLQRGNFERRMQAARLLCSFAPFTKKQQAAVQTLLDDPGRATIAPTLRSVLEHTNLFWRYLAAESDTEIPRTPLVDSMWSGVVKRVFVPVIINHHKVEPLPLRPCILSTQLMRGFQERLRSVPGVDSVRVRQLVCELDHDKFSRREKAIYQIAAMGLAAEPILRGELSRTDSLEMHRRLDGLLTQFKEERRITSRAIQILAIMETPDARRLLDLLASGSPNDGITREAEKAIRAKVKKDEERKSVRKE